MTTILSTLMDGESHFVMDRESKKLVARHIKTAVNIIKGKDERVWYVASTRVVAFLRKHRWGGDGTFAVCLLLLSSSLSPKRKKLLILHRVVHVGSHTIVRKRR